MTPAAAPALPFAVLAAATDAFAGVAVFVKSKHRMSLFVSHEAKIYLNAQKAMLVRYIFLRAPEPLSRP
jgi:hypothetical protein